ncbi:MAG: helix-turn-helix domain-containing protein [Wigglesworthia glossinidia]|nr:helix-turn-helix domain-containing protein [Wigglesworthia glossinidia]
MNIGENKKQKISNTIGKSLKKARKNLGLSQRDVAKILYLKISVIQSIENDSEHPYISKTFLYGYIRAYAKLVKLSEKELSLMNNKIQHYFPKIKSISQFNSIKKYKKKDIWFIRVTWTVISIIIILTGIWWWQSYRINHQNILNIKTLPFENSLQKILKKINII